MVTERTPGNTSSEMRIAYEDYLNDFGTIVVRNRYTETKDNMNRITSSSTETSTIKADIQWVSKKDLQHLHMGDVKIGDGMLFVLHDADILIEDEIVFNSQNYRVVEQIEGELVSGSVIYTGYLIRKNAQS